MKLLSKHRQEGGKVRRVYDAAKTPLQRLLLSEILPTDRQRHLCEVVQAIDPLRLLLHLEHVQQALWRCAGNASPLTHSTPAASLLHFCVQDCMQATLPPKEKVSAPASVLQRLQSEPSGATGLLDWPRTSRDPFEGQWERILALVLTHPEWSESDLFQQMQCLFPGHYRPSHQHTLQAGLRKIHARLLTIMQEPWPQEVIQADVPATVSVGFDQLGQEADRHAHAFHIPCAPLPVHWLPEHAPAGAKPVRHPSTAEEAISSPAVSTPPVAQQLTAQPGQTVFLLDASLPQACDQQSPQARFPALTIERAIQSYLQEQRAHERSFKTMEWHQTALGLFQQYLQRCAKMLSYQ